MAIDLTKVIVDKAVLASTVVQMAHHINVSGKRFVYTSAGTFTVPPGVHCIRVWLAGGGGAGKAAYDYAVGENQFWSDGGAGGDAPLISAYMLVTPAQQFAVGIGAAGTLASPTGGSSTFGADLISFGGGPGKGSILDSGYPRTGKGAPGSYTFAPGSTGNTLHGNEVFLHGYIDRIRYGYGQGGRGGTIYYDSNNTMQQEPRTDGRPGICVVEW